MDWRLAHALNGLLLGHPTAQRAVESFAAWSVPLYAAAVLALWLAARPGRPRLQLACVSALGAAGAGLLLNQAIGHVWFRDRPYVSHPDDLLLATRSHDPSFPSDHATAAFAIAFAVLAFSRPLGGLFLAGASAIALSRVLVGLHYPGDVLGGAATGLLAALVVAFAARPLVARVVALVSRLTDPALTPVWRLGDGARRRLPIDLLRRLPYGWRAISLVAVLAGSLLALGHLAEDYVTGDPIVGTDHRLANWLHVHSPDAVVAAFRIVTLAGSGVFLAALALAAAAYLWRRRNRLDAALVVSAYLGSELLTALLKVSFHRERPVLVDPFVRLDTYSFPSGHASVATAVYGALLLVALDRLVTGWRARATLTILVAGLVLLIGASRLVLGVHYLSDVLAGFSLGTAWLATCALALAWDGRLGRWRPVRALPGPRRRRARSG